MRQPWLHNFFIKTIYFGGGTPSVVDSQFIISFLNHLRKQGFNLARTEEISVEIDPGTVSEAKLDQYLSAGINRFSVGVQTFDEASLKKLGRKHSAQQARELLGWLQKRDVNFSADILFSLPHQSREHLHRDLKEILEFAPRHVSAYYLTLERGHPLQKGRPNDDQDLLMFGVLEDVLRLGGIHRYEISNYAQPGFESRHNTIYWNDEAYLGLGMSAHSYFPKHGDYGMRAHNENKILDYQQQILSTVAKTDFFQQWPEAWREQLQQHEALTDFCHTSLRRMTGIKMQDVAAKFSPTVMENVRARLTELENESLVETNSQGFQLSTKGKVLANQVFGHLTFLPDELR